MTRLIPPVLFLLLLLCLMPLSLLHPDSLVMRADAAMPWDIPIALGLTALFWGSWHFKRKKAEIHTFRQPQDLITDGPFRYSRNPMYLGFFLLLVGAAFYVNTWCALAAPLAFLLTAMYWYIPHEERRMRAAFGAAYDDYARTTRRWI
ncbi:isoprenylcysteine carboxylmethyltransferase family protein [Leisingera sp. XS_AS12]|uniref:methyltransferase family protein n=1 Tax=Leisingera sp. XS_AS12 TaxID=3241294 RepID=UPI003518ADF7